MHRLAIALPIAVLAASAAHADMTIAPPPPLLYSDNMGSAVAGEPYAMKIAVLRDKAKKWAKQDGGALSEAHLAQLRARLEKINPEEMARR
jgi:predicted alpha/beta hydrolase